MSFSVRLEGGEKEVVLDAESENGEVARLLTTPLAFTPWSIMFRDFLRLVYWFPHSRTIAEAVQDFFKEPFVFPDETGFQTNFFIGPREIGEIFEAELFVLQPSHSQRAAFSIQEGAAPHFLNVLALGLMRRSQSSFSVHSDELEEEDLFQYHGELRCIEDEFRATGLTPFWLTPEIQRLLVVSRAHDMGAQLVDGIPTPLLRFSEEKVLRVWTKEEMENLIRFVSELEREWSQHYRMAPKDSGEAVLALENWIFVLNLFGFLDRFLAGVLSTRMPNPTAPVLSFLLERFFITQWESNLWPARRSALEETYRILIPFLLS